MTNQLVWMGEDSGCHFSSVIQPEHQYLFKAIPFSTVRGSGGQKIRTFFQENSLQKRVLVTKHQTLICRTPVTLLKRLERLLIMFDSSLKLLNVLRPPFTERGLRLSVSLLSFLRCGIYLQIKRVSNAISGNRPSKHTGFLPPLRFCLWAASCTTTSPSGSGVDTDELHEPSWLGSDFGITISMWESSLRS